MLSARPATKLDALSLAARIRTQDKEDLKNAMGLNAVAGLLFSLEHSDDPTAIVTEDGLVIALFGCGESFHHRGAGSPWLIASNDLGDNRRYAIQFLRQGLPYIDAWHDRYPVLSNYSCLDNDLHTKWLKWCGFTFIGKTSFNHSPFGEFVRIK